MAIGPSSIASGLSAIPSVTIQPPVPGEIIIWAACCGGVGINPLLPTGFNGIAGPTTTATPDTQGFIIGYKLAVAGETGIYTGSHAAAGNDFWVCTAATLRGRAPAGWEATIVTNQTANATPVTITATGVTALAGDDAIFLAHWIRSGSSGSDSVAPPVSYTEQQELLNAWMGIEWASRESLSAGATGSVSATLTIGGGFTAGYNAVLLRWPSATYTNLRYKRVSPQQRML